MNGIGEITRIYIGDNDDESSHIRRLVLKVGIEENGQDIEHVEPAGEDSAPVTGDQAIVLQIADNYQIVIAVDDGITPEAEPGEKIIYSHTSGHRQAFIKLKTDGYVDIGNAENESPDDWAAKYEEVKSKLEELETAYNNLVSIFNAHGHIFTGIGTVQGPTASGSQSEIDFTTIKSDYVRIK